MTDAYYLISDLHIGGDEQLEQVDFLDELRSFLRDLEGTDEDAELIIVGDAFGLWELTSVDGPEKFDVLLDRYPELFDQLRATGERIDITLIPGNHDYELAVFSEYVERLAAYNVTLEQEISLTRTVGAYDVYLEHGMQRDPNNRIPEFGNRYANPPGYFVNRYVTSRAGRLSGRGKYNWLKDIQAVTPMTLIPEWLLSNYYYREMSSWLRYSTVPFLLLFNLALLHVGAFLLDETGIWSLPYTAIERAVGLFGPVGELANVFLVLDTVVIVLLMVVALPLYVFARDVRRTFRRFGLTRPSTDRNPDSAYLEAAREVFDDDPQVAVFVYGHTHRVSVTEMDDRVVVNTGTWLKRLHRAEPILGILPPVFYASYRLSYFRLTAAADGRVVVDHETAEKADPKEESLLERLVTRSPNRHVAIPDRTVVGPEPEQAESFEPNDVSPEN